MAEQRRVVYWDACIFLDWVNGVPEKLPVLDALLDRAGPSGDIEIVTSTLSIAEVAIARLDQTVGTYSPTLEAKIDALWSDPIIKLVEFHRGIAFDARELVRAANQAKLSLKAHDAIHFATARRIAAVEFQTYDRRLFKFAHLAGLPVQEPSTPQARLPGT